MAVCSEAWGTGISLSIYSAGTAIFELLSERLKSASLEQ
jgi:hypothetical protein